MAKLERKPSQMEEEYVPMKTYFSEKRRCALIAVLGVVAVAATAIGVAMSGITVLEEVEVANTQFTACQSYGQSSGDYKYFYEGIGCQECTSLDTYVSLGDCNHTCKDWTVNVETTEIDPVLSSCDDPDSDIVEPDYDGPCPIGYYKAKKKTGCKPEGFDEFLEVGSNCIYCGDTDITLQDCIDKCEETPECAGYAANPVIPDQCYAYTYEIEHICDRELDDSTVCKKIPSAMECYPEQLSYSDAKKRCEDDGGYLVTDADQEMKYDRINYLCPYADSVGCYVGDLGSADCYYVEKKDNKPNPGGDCDFRRGYCCEKDTPAPTVYPTKSPTYHIYFVIPNETDWDTADKKCKEYDAELVSIHSQEEQDLVWDICLESLLANKNPCGCWNGFNIVGQPITLDPDDFVWTDGSNNDFNFFETYPEVQPNNNGDRDEKCVHMRPFTRGGWNDLPCEGFCDADDTKPFPLCKKRTEAPTPSPTQYPTYSPTKYPTYSPTKFPTKKRTKSPTYSPTKYPTYSPTKYPTYSPTKYPTYSPTKYPTKKRTESPTYSPTKYPTYSPTKYPTYSPTKYPTYSPTKYPTYSPTKYPTKKRTESPTYSPTKYPTYSPTKYPTYSPTKYPTYSPTKYPTYSPTKYPTKKPTPYPTYTPSIGPTPKPTPKPTYSPTKYPTKKPTPEPTKKPTPYPTYSPTKYPTYSPTKYPTKKPTPYPTYSPTKYPTYSPTKYPTYSPTKYPTKKRTESPTYSPTKYPTYSPTKYPTKKRTESPTYSPTKYPTYSPTEYPTKKPSKKPTPYPTYSPTEYPTKKPTDPPTKYPTYSPTPEPTKKPDGKCYYKNGEGLWTVKNKRRKEIKCYYVFECSHLTSYVYDPRYYPYCSWRSDYCWGPHLKVQPGKTIGFLAPGPKVWWFCEDSCDYYNGHGGDDDDDDDDDDRRMLTNRKCWHESDKSDEKCKCEDKIYYSDDFDSYPLGFQYGSSSFWSKWDRFSGSLVYIRDNSYFLNKASDVCASPGGKCLDLVGKIKTERIKYDVYQGVEDLRLGFRKHVDVFCTVSFKAAGSRRCGKNLFDNSVQAYNAGCHEYYDTNINEKNDLKVKFHRNNGHVLASKSFKNINWQQGYKHYSVTADVWDRDPSAYVSFRSGGQTINKNLGRTGDRDQPVGNYIDDVDVTCCCVELFDKYVYKNVVYDPAYTYNGEPVPRKRRDPKSIENKPPNDNYFSAEYDRKDVEPQVVSLGLGGYAIYRFDSGFYKNLYIYEETLYKCKYKNRRWKCENQDDHEDAIVEVSVDGITWETVAQSLNDEYDWYIFDDEKDDRRRLQDGDSEPPVSDDADSNVTADAEDENNINDVPEDDDREFFVTGAPYTTFSRTGGYRTYHKYVKRIRYVKIVLPDNWACYKYVKITDSSYGRSDSDDGFDLHAIKTSHVCCNDNDYDDQLDSLNPKPVLLEVTLLSGAASGFYGIAAVVAVVAAALIVTQIRVSRSKNKFRRKSVMELDTKIVDEILHEKAPRRTSVPKVPPGLAPPGLVPAGEDI